MISGGRRYKNNFQSVYHLQSSDWIGWVRGQVSGFKSVRSWFKSLGSGSGLESGKVKTNLNLNVKVGVRISIAGVCLRDETNTCHLWRWDSPVERKPSGIISTSITMTTTMGMAVSVAFFVVTHGAPETEGRVGA